MNVRMQLIRAAAALAAEPSTPAPPTAGGVPCLSRLDREA